MPKEFEHYTGQDEHIAFTRRITWIDASLAGSHRQDHSSSSVSTERMDGMERQSALRSAEVTAEVRKQVSGIGRTVTSRSNTGFDARPIRVRGQPQIKAVQFISSILVDHR